MILNLVDRRTEGPSGNSAAEWFSVNATLLSELAARIGPPDWAVDLVLVEDGQMTDLNEGFRQVSGVTDVLSFSYLVPAGKNDVQLAQGLSYAPYDLKLDETEPTGGSAEDISPVVGEIVLAPGFVTRRCLANDWPAELEFPMLVVHGLLHVLGWDHLEAEEKLAMQDIEEKVLATANLTHPLRQRS